MATASPVQHVGAKPIFVDVTLRTYTLDPNEVKKKLSKRTKAIIPVHLYGHPADMDSILEIAEKNNLFVFEDACQAHGAEYKGKKVGGIGHSAFFSFYPSKNMTVCGDGGIVTTDNEEVAEKIRGVRAELAELIRIFREYKANVQKNSGLIVGEIEAVFFVILGCVGSFGSRVA